MVGVLIIVGGLRTIYGQGSGYQDYSGYSKAGAMVVTALPIIVLGPVLQRLFFGASWQTIRRKDIPRRTLRRYRQVLLVALLGIEVPLFWFLVPGIVGLGAAHGYAWCALLGCLFGALLAALSIGVLLYCFVLDPLSTRLRR
ncbi:hypothetical protein [Streptomyces sp. NPDC020917]|uniref:hypothetical protein n=1 Tax=Streptomyces sp. NPDC020917 TaxID=3365102 RepID=UPI0037BC36E6